jgi:uncharacterized protein (TIGR03067 family)
LLKWLRSLFGGHDEEPSVSLDALQGKWRMVSVGKNGNFAPPQFIANAKIFMIIQGDQYSIVNDGDAGDRGTIRLDASQKPAHFDQHISAGKDAGKVHLGIVRFRDGMLENCQADKGRERPKDFARNRKDGASLACFKKVANSN